MKYGTILKYHKCYLSPISLTNHAIYLYHHLRNSVIQHRLFSLVELFRFVAEQIGFKVPVFRPLGPDIDPGRCTFLTVVFCSSVVNFLLVLESPEL